MRSTPAAALLALAGCLLSPTLCRGQQIQEPDRVSGVVLALWGGLSGLGLAAAHVNPSGPGLLMSDETAFPLGLAVGVGTALVVHAAGRSFDPTVGRRPRLRFSAGSGGSPDVEYSLGIRQPVRTNWEVDASILVASDTWERSETQTRCSLLIGCYTGNFITAYSYQQSAAAHVGGVRHLSATSEWYPTIFAAGGPTVTSISSDDGTSRHTGISVGGGVGVERGGRYRWTGVTGVRLTPIGSTPQATLDDFTWYVRLGLALGG
jgi:hypothetical protein